jgi:hypothetical protein
MKELTLKALLLIFIITAFSACKDVDESLPQTWEDNPLAVADKERIEEEERIRIEEEEERIRIEELSTTTDSTTGLMWQDNDYETTHTWNNALSYCYELTLVEYSDWRLPNRAELKDLVVKRNILKSYVSSNNTYYWSSTERTTDTAIIVEFGGDLDSYYSNKTNEEYVRCVRSIL